MSSDKEDEFPAFEDDEELFSEEDEEFHFDDEELAKVFEQISQPAAKNPPKDNPVPPLRNTESSLRKTLEKAGDDEDDDDEDDESDEDDVDEKNEEELTDPESDSWSSAEEALPEEELQEEKTPPAPPPIPAVASKTTKPLTPETLPMTIVVEVGRLQMSLKKLIELQPGNVLDLNLHPENGVDLVVNGTIIGKGELLLIGNALGVRILEKG